MISNELLQAILKGYVLSPWGIHGLSHWARVLENGRRLAAVNGAILEVVELFARLATNAGCDPGIIRWAVARSIDPATPQLVAQEWGLTLE